MNDPLNQVGNVLNVVQYFCKEEICANKSKKINKGMIKHCFKGSWHQIAFIIYSTTFYDYGEGGLNITDVDCLNKALKLRQ